MKKMFAQIFCAAIRQKDGRLIEVLRSTYFHILRQIVSEPLICQRKFFYSFLRKIPLNICRKKAGRKIRQLNMIEMVKGFDRP